MKEKSLVEGLYLSEHDNGMFDRYKIIINLRETEKSYIFDLVEYESRYSPAQMDALFENNKKVVIKKRNSGHAMRLWSNSCFTIYPFQSGIPFRFDLIPDKSIETDNKGDNNCMDEIWKLAALICEEVFDDREYECQEQIYETIRNFVEKGTHCSFCNTVSNDKKRREECRCNDAVGKSCSCCGKA